MKTLTYGRFTVEAVDLDCTSASAAGRARDARRRGVPATMSRAEPVGNGPQLLVRMSGYVIAYVRTPDEALALITGEVSP